MCSPSAVRHMCRGLHSKGNIWIRLWPAPLFRHRLIRAGQGPRRGLLVLVWAERLCCESGCGC